MDYKQKYLKYKQKYVELKKQLGGIPPHVPCPDHLQVLTNFWKQIGQKIQAIAPRLEAGYQVTMNSTYNSCNLYIWYDNDTPGTHIDVFWENLPADFEERLHDIGHRALDPDPYGSGFNISYRIKCRGRHVGRVNQVYLSNNMSYANKIDTVADRLSRDLYNLRRRC
jgi:hypothetical protein